MSEKNILALCATPAAAREVATDIAETIGASFFEEERHLKRAEVNRRYDICARIFCALVGDLSWSIQKALHFLPTYLRCELDGVAWEPDKRAFWLPNEA